MLMIIFEFRLFSDRDRERGEREMITRDRENRDPRDRESRDPRDRDGRDNRDLRYDFKF